MLKPSTLDVFCIHIRAQDAALIVRRLTTAGSFQIEAFKVSPLSRAVIEVERKLLCSYPGPAIQIPADIFMDKCFLRELSSFLVQMDVDHLNNGEIPPPDYILELLVGILRGYGQPAVAVCITKRIGDEDLFSEGWERGGTRKWPEKSLQWLWDHDVPGLHYIFPQSAMERVMDTNRRWRRSPLWLVLKVSLQSSVSSTQGGLGPGIPDRGLVS